jgi:hypothetical protein
MSQTIPRFLGIAAFSLLAVFAAAANFSVITKIYVGTSDVPASQHRVLFDEGLAYDLSISEQRFVTVFDPAQGSVVLLDRETETQTVIALDDLLKVTAQAKASISEPADRERLGIDAKVISDDGYSINFAGTEYTARTEQPSDPAMATAYGRFADLALRLNILRPLGPPPFARMTLNSHIAAKGEIATESTLTLIRGNAGAENQRTRYRSTNQIGELEASDRTSIEEIRGLLALYRQVPLKEFPTQ